MSGNSLIIQQYMDEPKDVVNQAPVTGEPVREDLNLKEQEPGASGEALEKPATQAGDKTDPNLLLKSLREERARVKQLEEELEQAKSPALSDEVFSDEGKALKGEIDSLKSEVSELRGDRAKQDVLIAYPVLKDKWEELEEFRSQTDNKGMNLRTAAKAFLVENGLLEATRKGLEKTTGGPRIPLTSGMTAEDVKTLRETNFRKYQEMLMKGQIKIE